MEAAQALREEQMRERGRRRAKGAIQKAEERGEFAETPAGTALMQRAIEPLTKAIEEFIADAQSGRPGRRHQAARFLIGVDPALAAYATVRTALAAAPRRSSLVATAVRVGRALETELIAAAFEAENKALYKAVVRKAKSRGLTPQRIAKAVELANKHFEVTPTLWTEQERIHIGTKLVEMAVERLGIIQVHINPIGKNRFQHRLELTAETAAWYARFNEAAALAKPMWLPTVTPPKPWEAIRGGGYHTDRIRAQPLLTRAFPGQADKLQEADMSTVYTALNGLQSTPWRINRRVLDVMAHAWEHGLDFPSLPQRFDEPLPEKPEEVANAPKGSPLRKEWRELTGPIHRRNAQSRSDRFTFDRLLEIAKENANEPAIYFPHRLDFSFPLLSRNDRVKVKLVNDSWLPCSFVSAKWRGTWNPSSRQQ